MCAIAGVLDLQADAQIAGKLLDTMARRGPDAASFFVKNKCMLLHARLAVIDPAGGSQPMTWCAVDETYTIVYNGELYNTPELRRELIAQGHRFEGHSDTEVLLHAYAQWKDSCLEKLNGIYAFGVWEHKRERLFLARDRMGVKPLFYSQHGGGLLFASEIKTILAYPTVKPMLDEQGAAELLLLGPGRTPGCGIFHGILELEPGCCGYYEKGSFYKRRYWQLRDREHTQSLAETVEEVQFLVTDAIRRQTVSDVPLGTFLSGGLDSSLITALCAKEAEKQGRTLKTFSVDYADNDRYFVPTKFQPNSDGHYIRLMQQELNTDHTWCVISPEELSGAMEAATDARDLPGMADVDMSLLIFCRKIRENVTVALSGECADEIFGGYPWYRDPEVRGREGFPWAQNTAQRCAMLSPELAGRIDGEAYIRQRYEDTCRSSDILPGTAPLERRMKEMVNLNQQWFMQTLLDRKDRMSMYWGLEVRVPFCDHRIAEYLYGVPWHMKDHEGREKGLLRLAMEGLLPEEVLWRKKSPYPKTWDPGYLDIVSCRLNDVLQQKDSPLYYLVSRDAALRTLTQDDPWPWYGQLMRRPQKICYLLQLEYWLRSNAVDFLY